MSEKLNQVNNKIFDDEKVRIKIINASSVYLPIPKQELQYSFVFLYIDIEILNKTESEIYLDPDDTFLSEIVSYNNKSVTRKLAILQSNSIEKKTNKLNLFWQYISFMISDFSNKKEVDLEALNYKIISPKHSVNMTFGLRMFLRKNLLFLALPTTAEYIYSSRNPRKFCVFENMRLGEYNIKFVYTPKRSQKLEILKEKNHNIINSEQPISTLPIKLNLTLPTKAEPNTLTTPNIKFQALITEKNNIKLSNLTKKANLWEFLTSLFVRSSSHPKPYIFLPICFRIINQSSISYRFDFHNFQPPDLIYNGDRIDWTVTNSSLRQTNPKLEDFPMVMPNNSIDFYPNIAIFLSGWSQFKLSLFSRNGCHLISDVLQLGQYHICFNYHHKNKNTFAYDTKTQKMLLLEDFWIGSVLTPFIDINLSPP